MAIPIEDFLERFSLISENLAERLRENEKSVYKILEREEQDIFAREEGPQGENWRPISSITLLKREKSPPQTYTDASDVIQDAKKANPLQDTGELMKSVTQGNRYSIRESNFISRGIEYRFGTDKPGASKHQQGQGTASRISEEERRRIFQRAPRGSARALAAVLYNHFKDNPGDIPQRKFLYITDRGIRKVSEFVAEQTAITIREIF